MYRNEILTREKENAWFAQQEIRDRAIARFTAHGLCAQCGGDFGMQDIYLEDLAEFPPQPGERFFRCDSDPEGCAWLWHPCEVCNRGGCSGNDFHELSREDVDVLVAGYIGTCPALYHPVQDGVGQVQGDLVMNENNDPRILCMKCGADLGPSPTPEDSHGLCDECGAALMGIAVEEFRARVAGDMEERRKESWWR